MAYESCAKAEPNSALHPSLKIAQIRPNEVPHQEKRQSGDFKIYLNNLGQSGSRDFVIHSRNALCNSVTYIERVIARLASREPCSSRSK